MSLLERINTPAQLKDLDMPQLSELCTELRSFLIDSVSHTGGHLSANLGVVELTVALHLVYDTSRDRLLFDVGHQCYIHKLLTGRREEFGTLRKKGGISGFPKPGESEHDAFVAGHASTSVSAALGMARARTISRSDYDVVAVIGDGALTGGTAYEALNDAGESGEPLVVVLNDNGMAISRNVGGVSRYLARERMKPAYLRFKHWYRRILGKIPGGKGIYNFTHRVKSQLKNAIFHCSMFEDMGFQYIGPVDGHNISALRQALQLAKDMRCPVLVHVNTVKGKGREYTEKLPDMYHGVGSFDADTGHLAGSSRDYSAVFGRTLSKLASEDKRICAVTAAMPVSTGLSDFAARYPKRFFDVGIAEGHAAAMCGGLAKQGMLPVFAVYSTFLQRSYDMLMQDIALMGMHVILAVDRAGLVGGDGETHHGVFDVAFLSSVPGMSIWCPASFDELESMLRHALYGEIGPVAVRYPRGGKQCMECRGADSFSVLRRGSDITLVTYGELTAYALEAADLAKKAGIDVEVIKLGRIKPVDFDTVFASAEKTGHLVVAECCVMSGCVGSAIVSEAAARGINAAGVRLLNLGDKFSGQGSTEELLADCGLDTQGILRAITEEKSK